MNERIKELYNQTSNETADGKEWAIGGLHNAERFAELIVQECIATVQKRYMGDNNREDMEVLRCVADMKKHFGGEE